MLTKSIQTIFSYRHKLKWLIPIRRPILLRLADFKMYVRLDDWAVGARIAVKRSYETHVTQVMASYLQQGMTFLDIGANIGYYTLLAAAKVGSMGKIVAFEPSEQNCQLVRLSLEANSFSQVSLYPYAVGNQNGVIGFRMDDSNGVVSADLTAATQQVQMVRLDEFLKDEPRLDVVKMDIEGAEGLAMQGMIGLLKRYKPIVFTEFNAHAIPKVSGITGEAYLSLFTDLGYELFVLEKQGKHATPQSVAEIMNYFANPAIHHLDLVALPEPK